MKQSCLRRLLFFGSMAKDIIGGGTATLLKIIGVFSLQRVVASDSFLEFGHTGNITGDKTICLFLILPSKKRRARIFCYFSCGVINAGVRRKFAGINTK